MMPLAVGCLTLLMTGRALVVGAASVDGDGITRADEPLFYWLCIAAGVVAAVFLFYIGLRNIGR